MSIRRDLALIIQEIFLRDIMGSLRFARTLIFLIRGSDLTAQISGLLSVNVNGLRLALSGRLNALGDCRLTNDLISRVLSAKFRRTNYRLATGYLFGVYFVGLGLLYGVGDLGSVLVNLMTSDARGDNCERLLLAISMDMRRVISVNYGLGPQTTRQGGAYQVRLDTVYVSTLSRRRAEETIRLQCGSAFNTISSRDTFFNRVEGEARVSVLGRNIRVLVVLINAQRFGYDLWERAMYGTAASALLSEVTEQFCVMVWRLWCRVITNVYSEGILTRGFVRALVLPRLNEDIRLRRVVR